MTEQVLEPPRENAGFTRDVLKLVSGTVVAQALVVVATPLLTRLYGPSAFGTSEIFVSIVAILSVVVCLRYEFAIMLPENDDEAANLLASSLVISLFLSIILIPPIWFGGPLILHLLKVPELGPYLWLIPPTILFGGIGTGHPALNYWATRYQSFTRLSITRVVGLISTLGIQLGSGFAGYASAGSLIVSKLLGSMISPLILGWLIWRDQRNLFFRSINLRNMLREIKRYRKFPIYGIWSSLLIAISGQLPSILLSIFFSTTVVGYYALGNRLLFAPMSIVGASISQVFIQRASQARFNNTLPHTVEIIFSQLNVVGLFPFLLLTFMGRDLFLLVFGEKWVEAGVYVQFLSLLSFFQFIYAPMSSMFNVLEKQRLGLFINLLFFIVRFVALAIGGLSKDARMAILVYTLFGIPTYIISIFAVMHISGVSWRKMLSILLLNLLRFVPVCAIFLGLSFISVGIWAKIGISIFLLIGYYWLLIINNQKSIE